MQKKSPAKRSVGLAFSALFCYASDFYRAKKALLYLTISIEKQKKRTVRLYQNHGSYVAGALRLELRRTVLETAMLPLHHAPACKWDYKGVSVNLQAFYMAAAVKK